MLRPAVILACLSGLPGAELVMRDIGAGLELQPTALDYTVSSGVGDASGSDALSSAVGLELHGRYSLAGTGATHGAVLGLGLAAGRADYPGGGEWSTYTVRGLAGWGWAPTDRVTLLAEALLGLGVARLSLSSDAYDLSTTGAIIEPGVQVGIHVGISDSVIAFGTLGYRRGIARLTGDDTDISLTISGLAVAFGVDWRLSNRPFLLE